MTTPTYELHCADCLDVMREMPDGAVDACITDPPYGIGIDRKIGGSNRGQVKDYGDTSWDAGRVSPETIQEMLRVSCHQVIFGGNFYADLLPPSSSWIVWDKLRTGNFADCELAWTSHEKAVRRYAYLWNGMIKQMPEKRFHPTQKPLSLMIWVLENYTKSGDTILDPFMGSGTTGVACMRTGRNFIGVEIDEQYHAIAQRRIADAAAQPLLLEV